ncbi:YkgJ family cysteine cluster protein [Alcanivorax quisquiliarum]|uniref:YkgJ family cysteine cluster protein n=1 Tax=Alcanivorax quisquiliarum TaxID=2933565 RepID=UPI00352D0422
MSNSFPCSQCGGCCRQVDSVDETRFLDRGDGTCRHLDENTDLCLIYETRPDICCVKTQYFKNYKNNYSWSEFVSINLQACEIIKNRHL